MRKEATCQVQETTTYEPIAEIHGGISFGWHVGCVCQKEEEAMTVPFLYVIFEDGLREKIDKIAVKFVKSWGASDVGNVHIYKFYGCSKDRQLNQRIMRLGLELVALRASDPSCHSMEIVDELGSV